MKQIKQKIGELLMEVKTMLDKVNDNFEINEEQVIVHVMNMGDIKRNDSYVTGMVLVVEKKRNLLKVVTTLEGNKRYIVETKLEYDICIVEKQQQLLLPQLPKLKKRKLKKNDC